MRNAPLQSTANTPTEQSNPTAESRFEHRARITHGAIELGVAEFVDGDTGQRQAVIHGHLADCAELTAADLGDLIAQTESFMVALHILRARAAARGGDQ